MTTYDPMSLHGLHERLTRVEARLAALEANDAPPRDVIGNANYELREPETPPAPLTPDQVLAGVAEPTIEEMREAYDNRAPLPDWLLSAFSDSDTTIIIAALVRERRARLEAEARLSERSEA